MDRMLGTLLSMLNQAGRNANFETSMIQLLERITTRNSGSRMYLGELLANWLLVVWWLIWWKRWTTEITSYHEDICVRHDRTGCTCFVLGLHVVHQMEAGISMASTKKLDQLKKEGCPRMKGETPIGGNFAAASILCSRELPKEAVRWTTSALVFILLVEIGSICLDCML